MGGRVLLLLGVLSLTVPRLAAAYVKPLFLYYLSNFEGVISSNWAVVQVDRRRDEIYVLDPRDQDIRVFNEKGMEIYRFGDDGSLGTMLDVAVEDDGNILVLTRQASRTSLRRCNFRGEPLSVLPLRGLPEAFRPFAPSLLAYRQGRIYLLDSAAMRIAVFDDKGIYRQGQDLARLIGLEDDKRAETEVGGFSVDKDGNILFTVPVLFSAYRLAPDGTLQGFGRPGSAPGKFGVVGDIDSDDRGYLYVADRLKCVVLIFDQDLTFVTEFGYRGPQPRNLIGPKNLAVDAHDRLYVSQLAGRGISVFQLVHGTRPYGSQQERR